MHNLNHSHKSFKRIIYLVRGIDWWLIAIFLTLAIIGMVIMYSSSFNHYETRFNAHGRNILMAFGIALIIAQIPPRLMMQLAVPIYCIGIILLLSVLLFGITHKGAQRWLKIGIEIQPSELLKFALPLILAWWFHKYRDLVRWQRFGIAFILLLIPTLLVLKQPDLGTAILIGCVGFTIIFFAGLNWKLIFFPFFILISIVSLVIAFEDQLCQSDVKWYVMHDYQKNRVCTMLNPNKDPLGKGFHVLQGEIAIGAGGLYGRGFLQGTQTHLEFVPERTTDFIFAAYAEEFGFVGSLILLGLFLCLIFRSMYIAYNAKSIFCQLLASSMALAFVFYIFINIGMVIGILPVVGVPLPFISYGGTAMIVIGMITGILLSISRDNYLETHKLKQHQQIFL